MSELKKAYRLRAEVYVYADSWEQAEFSLDYCLSKSARVSEIEYECIAVELLVDGEEFEAIEPRPYPEDFDAEELAEIAGALADEEEE